MSGVAVSETRGSKTNPEECDATQPRAPGGFVCSVCDRYFGDRWYCGPAGHTVRIGRKVFWARCVCLECYIHSHIPSGYMRWERYQGDRATQRPRMGIEWLDQRHWTVSEVLGICDRKPRWRRSR